MRAKPAKTFLDILHKLFDPHLQVYKKPYHLPDRPTKVFMNGPLDARDQLPLRFYATGKNYSGGNNRPFPLGSF